ncbi:hypothetical protein RhiirA4_405356, partial [Rhizophagus irregularis]
MNVYVYFQYSSENYLIVIYLIVLRILILTEPKVFYNEELLLVVHYPINDAPRMKVPTDELNIY